MGYPIVAARKSARSPRNIVLSPDDRRVKGGRLQVRRLSKEDRTWSTVILGILVLILFSILRVALQPQQTLAEAQVVLTVEVRDESGAVIPGAQVKLTKRLEDQGVTAHTDSAGTISLHLEAGSYQLSVSMNGFKTTMRQLDVGNAVQQTAAVVLRVGGCPIPDPCPVVPEKEYERPSNSEVSSSAKPPFSIRLQPVQSAVRAGKPILFQITITNTTNHPVLVETRIPTWWSAFEVRDDRGQTSPSRRGRVLADPAHRGIRPEDYPPLEGGPAWLLAPQQSAVVENVPMSDLHDLSQPGTYQVLVRRPDGVGGVVKSNTVIITVTP